MAWATDAANGENLSFPNAQARMATCALYFALLTEAQNRLLAWAFSQSDIDPQVGRRKRGPSIHKNIRSLFARLEKEAERETLQHHLSEVAASLAALAQARTRATYLFVGAHDRDIIASLPKNVQAAEDAFSAFQRLESDATGLAKARRAVLSAPKSRLR